MSDSNRHELQSVLDELQRQLADAASRILELEESLGGRARAADAALADRGSADAGAGSGQAQDREAEAGRGQAQGREAPPAEAAGVPEEIVMVISAAVAAFLGERARVRQIRLISSQAWAQQGRVSIQASHRLER